MCSLSQSFRLRVRRHGGAESGDRLCAVRADVVAAEAQLLDLADCAHAQRIAQYDGALVAQVVPADQNFGH